MPGFTCSSSFTCKIKLTRKVVRVGPLKGPETVYPAGQGEKIFQPFFTWEKRGALETANQINCYYYSFIRRETKLINTCNLRSTTHILTNASEPSSQSTISQSTASIAFDLITLDFLLSFITTHSCFNISMQTIRKPRYRRTRELWELIYIYKHQKLQFIVFWYSSR